MLMRNRLLLGASAAIVLSGFGTVISGQPHDRSHYEHAHESPMVVLIPLAVLAAGSILAGYPFKDLFAGEEIKVPEPAPEAPEVDLMEALRQSVADAQKRKPAKAAAPAKPRRRAAAKK